jgi:hypothetical protein
MTLYFSKKIVDACTDDGNSQNNISHNSRTSKTITVMDKNRSTVSTVNCAKDPTTAQCNSGLTTTTNTTNDNTPITYIPFNAIPLGKLMPVHVAAITGMQDTNKNEQMSKKIEEWKKKVSKFANQVIKAKLVDVAMDIAVEDPLNQPSKDITTPE